MAKRSTKRDSEIDVVDWLRKLPKAELHLHLEGTILPETLVELSQRHDAEPLTLELARELYKYENFLGFLMSFKAVTERLHGPEDYELIAYNMVRELAAQGVVHAEVYISFGIIYYWKKTEVEPYVEAIERGRLRGEQEFGTTVLWIIDAVRHFGAEEAARVFEEEAPRRREGDIALRSVEEIDTELALELSDLRAQRRLRQVQAFGSPPEMQLLGYRNEVPKTT